MRHTRVVAAMSSAHRLYAKCADSLIRATYGYAIVGGDAVTVVSRRPVDVNGQIALVDSARGRDHVENV